MYNVFMYSSLFFFYILVKVNFSQQIFEKYSYINFHENPSSGSRVVAWGRVERFADVTKLTVSFRRVASAPEKLDVSRIRSGNI